MSHEILIGADHRGFSSKGKVLAWLREHGFVPTDLGTHSQDRCDALDFAKQMAEELKKGAAQTGILICGSGQAMTMTANRYQNIRAALCMSPDMARLAREHNDANVLTLGADMVDEKTMLAIIETFLKTKFLGGRYAERRDRLTELGGL